MFLVESILMQAQMQLGLLHLGEENQQAEPNLPMARHSIDLLAMLQEKTRGNLGVEEQRLLENGLTELRFRYVQVADEVKRKNQPKAEPKQEEDKGPRGRRGPRGAARAARGCGERRGGARSRAPA